MAHQWRGAWRSTAMALIAIALTTACSPTSGASQPIAASSASIAPSLAPSLAPSPTPEVTQMTTPSPTAAALALTSPAFQDGQPIPARFSCHGADVSPALAWTGVPADATGLVLFVDDPDGRDWVHWSVLDLPAKDGELPEGVDPKAGTPQQGTNDFRKVGYGGPCPPSGTHHYRFTLYALAAPLALEGHPDGAAVRAALGRATVLARVTLTGTYRA